MPPAASPTLLHAQRARDAAYQRCKDILDPAAAAKRELTDAERRAYEAAEADLDVASQRVQNLQDALTAERGLTESLSRFGGHSPRWEHAQTDEERDLDAAFRAAILHRDRRPIVIEPREARSGWQPALERRDLLTSSGTGLVRTSFYNQMLMHLVDSSAILAAGATVLQTESGEPFKVPKSTAHATAAIVSEGATIPESDPSVGTVTLGAYKYGFVTQISTELAEDASFDVAGYLAAQAGIALGNGFGAHAITGTGTSQPSGILTNATLGVTGGTGVTGAFTADNLIDLMHSVAEPYARSASAGWLMRNSTLAAVRKLKDSQNRYLFDVAVPPGSGAAGTLLGRPVFLDPTMPAVALNAKSVLFGDISRYWVRTAGAVRFERSDEFAFTNDLVTFRGLLRIDGALVDTTGAVKYFQGAAT